MAVRNVCPRSASDPAGTDSDSDAPTDDSMICLFLSFRNADEIDRTYPGLQRIPSQLLDVRQEIFFVTSLEEFRINNAALRVPIPCINARVEPIRLTTIHRDSRFARFFPGLCRGLS
jgi:hypothetical protein